MRVAVVQSGQCSEDLDANLDVLASLVRQAAAPGTDLVLLPEMSTTPYFAGAPISERYRAWAQPVPGPWTQYFGALCRELDTAIAFGMFEDGQDGNYYNSLAVLNRAGEVVPGTLHDGTQVPAFRKLTAPKVSMPGFTLDEGAYCTAGPGPMTFEVDGVRLGALICYDRAFSEVWLANRHLGAQVILASVSSFGWREQLFVPDLRVRAAEVGCFVVTANRAGHETVGGHATEYFGRSCIIGPDGLVLAEAPGFVQPEIIRADLDLAAIEPAREAWPVWIDRRPELYEFMYTDRAISPSQTEV